MSENTESPHPTLRVSLEHRMRLEPIEYYLARWRLRWARYVSRMHFSRLPRMFLSSWVRHKRPQQTEQRPRFNYGHGLLRDLRKAGVPFKGWDILAGDQYLWHTITQQKNVNCNAAGCGYTRLYSEQHDQDT
jgi:hypothetical protein